MTTPPPRVLLRKKRPDAELESPAAPLLPSAPPLPEGVEPLKPTHLLALAPAGLEDVLLAEVRSLGVANPTRLKGGVLWDYSFDSMVRANLELRTATRVLAQLRTFSAGTPEMLYDQVRRIPWERLLTPEMTFAVDCSLHSTPGLTHGLGTALKIKDAIADRMRRECGGVRASVDRESPDLRVNARIFQGKCTLSLDSSGHPLHERGYRSGDSGAPLKENLAAGLLLLTGEIQEGQALDRPILDPMCGSGTLLIEAALLLARKAPGLGLRFGFERWRGTDLKRAMELRSEARARVIPSPAEPLLMGWDESASAIRAAEQGAAKAGVSKWIRFEKGLLTHWRPSRGAALVVTNPPYGVRLGEGADLPALYRTLGEKLKTSLPGGSAWILAGNAELTGNLKMRADRRIQVYNGALDCRWLNYRLREAAPGLRTEKDDAYGQQSAITPF